MNYTYVPLPLVEEASSVSASAQVLVIDDGEVKRTDAANIGIKPTGKLTLTNTTETDCTNYAAVQIVDANLLAENIKKDVSVLGITGSYEGGGSSDFSTAEVTFVNTSSTALIYLGAVAGVDNNSIVYEETIPVSTAGSVFNAILYKGSTYVEPWIESDGNLSVTVSGDATATENEGEWVINVTGDCTITFAVT